MILSVDPGRDKTGCAVVEEDGSLVVKKVIPTKNYEKEIAKLLSSFTPGPSSWVTAPATGK